MRTEAGKGEGQGRDASAARLNPKRTAVLDTVHMVYTMPILAKSWRDSIADSVRDMLDSHDQDFDREQFLYGLAGLGAKFAGLQESEAMTLLGIAYDESSQKTAKRMSSDEMERQRRNSNFQIPNMVEISFMDLRAISDAAAESGRKKIAGALNYSSLGILFPLAAIGARLTSLTSQETTEALLTVYRDVYTSVNTKKK